MNISTTPPRRCGAYQPKGLVVTVLQLIREAKARKKLNVFLKKVKADAEGRQEAGKKRLNRDKPMAYYIEGSDERLDFLRLQRTLGMTPGQALDWVEHHRNIAKILGQHFCLVPCAPVMGSVHNLRVCTPGHHINPSAHSHPLQRT